ncbi:hypothetical protein PACTADRAFT_51600 [Pachysolen tannophilus NRRL Y-2460]|uniref:Maintenance of telomere capping protein 6 n=1 Tax=Pachysolen tannophilus NRRL Y-2460 TaxID=669874 RepID=A0A1E4TQ56_PACTA|nr:hypothetical protein PACTADRAFT_51600 [Pachysolen tannophilus NRRL Y-2460]
MKFMIIAISFLISYAVNCLTIDASLEIGILSQRDLSANTTIDQLTLPGINLNQVVFNSIGYTNDSYSYITDLLNLGSSIFEINVYWNEKLAIWQVCPVPYSENVTELATIQKLENDDDTSFKCQRSFNLSTILTAFSEHFAETDTHLNADLMQMYLNLYSLNPAYDYPDDYVNSAEKYESLSSIIISEVSDIYKYSDLKADRANNKTYSSDGRSKSFEGYPTFSHVLFEKYKRLIPIVASNNLDSDSSYNSSLLDIDSDYILFNGSNGFELTSYTFLNDTCQSDALENGEKKPFKTISNQVSEWNFTLDSYKAYIECGISPILNSSFSPYDSISDYLNISLWSWNVNQPTIGTGTDEDEDYTCALFDSTGGWRVGSCSEQYPIACKNTSTNFEWIIANISKDYFSAGDYCPAGTVFDTPRNALDNLALMKTLNLEDDDVSDVWIDLNCINVENCWVTGGPEASCPYADIITKKLLVEMITPASVVSFVLLILTILAKFDNVPIQSNRRHWKKLINEYSKDEYEGVPS